MKIIELALNTLMVALGATAIVGLIWLGYGTGKAVGYEMAIDSIPVLLGLERPTSCEPTSSFRTINGLVLVTLLCPDSIGPRPTDPARRHE